MKNNSAKLKNRLLAILAVAAGIFELSLFQNEAIGVSAQVDPVAFMGPNADFSFVFPGEKLEKGFYIQSAEGYEGRIPYKIISQVKPREGVAAEYCLANPSDFEKCYPSLCPYLNVLSMEGEGDTKDSAKMDPPEDASDTWKVVLDSPPIEGYAPQDFEGVPADSPGVYGCDIKLVSLEELPPVFFGGPVVKAKWEMNAVKDENGKYLGNDDDTASGTQFMPSGQYRINKDIAVCAVATDPNGVSYLDSVSADVFWPRDISLGPGHESGKNGCGQKVGQIALTPLGKDEGKELFCDKIRNNNNNLPAFNASGSYAYDEICGSQGELSRGAASVYCGQMPLSYEDPSGDYKTIVSAQNKNGDKSSFENSFRYLDLTAFEIDFTNIDYGTVDQNVRKTINGNSAFDPLDGKATARNIGNTRLGIKVAQDDTELGKTGEEWNVRYGARVGEGSSFIGYYPEETALLLDRLNLSETASMDFYVEVSEFSDKDSYKGNMTVGAAVAPHLSCE